MRLLIHAREVANKGSRIAIGTVYGGVPLVQSQWIA